jgi:hypothetical protein
MLRIAGLAVGIACSALLGAAQLSTQDHLADPGFWPTQDQATRAEFAGPEACARCHRAIAASQVETPMARNMSPASDTAILRSHKALSFTPNQFKYAIDTDGKQATYSITRDAEHLSYPLQWAFGTGRVAQSYLFRKDDGGFYEARASYFTPSKSLDFTPGRDLLKPSKIEEAMYRPVGMSEVQRCFACHATAANIAGTFDEKHLIPGVTCEACHGPGVNHVKTAEHPVAGGAATAKPAIFNPATLSPADAVDFCGSCHSSWWDVKLSGGKGPSTTRSAPYRLVTSKCWGKGDERLTCAACHDPHLQLATDATAYDHVCKSCHVGAGEKPTASHPGLACATKATSKCSDCHMQKTFVPEMHADFTDHRIRIVHAGETFPE